MANKKGRKKCLTQYLKNPYRIMNSMICRLYGEETSTHFRMEWFPMAYTMVKNGQAFNWEIILSFNITNQVLDPKGITNHVFYMSSYLIDVICATRYFLVFNWAWTLDQGLVHVYYSQLWEAKYKEHSYPHRISPGAIKSMNGIEDWYMKKYYSYVRIFAAT
jgi:hypothetical protein